jgi:hypothetical protein
MLSVPYKAVMLSVVMLNVVTLSVAAPSRTFVAVVGSLPLMRDSMRRLRGVDISLYRNVFYGRN